MADDDIPIVRIPGLPDFNEDNTSTFNMEDILNWDSTAPPAAVLVGNGGGPGAVASGAWQPAEEYITLVGSIRVDPAEQENYRRLLLTGLPATRDVPLVVFGGEWDIDKQMFVRRYDRPDIKKGVGSLDFTIPLVATDPYKYALEPLAGTLGVFAGTTWYREYPNTTPRARNYVVGGGKSVRNYTKAQPPGPYPEALSVEGFGSVVSRRVKVTITGPLIAGSWWFYNETATQRLWADLDVSTEYPLILDTFTQTATVGGEDVTDLIYGDWPVLNPGGNTYRLAAAKYSAAFADVTAYEAFE